jgi:hypothetical protein
LEWANKEDVSVANVESERLDEPMIVIFGAVSNVPPVPAVNEMDVDEFGLYIERLPAFSQNSWIDSTLSEGQASKTIIGKGEDIDELYTASTAVPFEITDRVSGFVERGPETTDRIDAERDVDDVGEKVVEEKM